MTGKNPLSALTVLFGDCGLERDMYAWQRLILQQPPLQANIDGNRLSINPPCSTVISRSRINPATDGAPYFSIAAYCAHQRILATIISSALSCDYIHTICLVDEEPLSDVAPLYGRRSLTNTGCSYPYFTLLQGGTRLEVKSSIQQILDRVLH